MTLRLVIESAPGPQAVLLLVGSFNPVHRGHFALLDAARAAETPRM